MEILNYPLTFPIIEFLEKVLGFPPIEAELSVLVVVVVGGLSLRGWWKNTHAFHLDLARGCACVCMCM